MMPPCSRLTGRNGTLRIRGRPAASGGQPNEAEIIAHMPPACIRKPGSQLPRTYVFHNTAEEADAFPMPSKGSNGVEDGDD